MDFKIIDHKSEIPASATQQAYLVIDRWNDFSFVTMFYLHLHDDNEVLHEIGNIKIGFKGQTTKIDTYTTLTTPFNNLPENYFSLGMGVHYYKNLTTISKELRNEVLRSLKDIVFNPSLFEEVKNEDVFQTSLLRDTSITAIRGQYTRVLAGKSPLTDFNFIYQRPDKENKGGIELEFNVKANSKPSTNIHAIIGRNGAGKTTLLNDMTQAITRDDEANSEFLQKEFIIRKPIDKNYFSSLVSVSFSAFDPFTPPHEQPDPLKGTCYFYIGLKNSTNDSHNTLKTLQNLHKEFYDALKLCFSQVDKKKRWEKAIQTLESDENFNEMQLLDLLDDTPEELKSKAIALIKRMSSGHAVVLLTITKLVARVEEKTLVLIDEPESHLHPPLLSAFIRSLSELLHNRNGVAIIATHSPVVLQEIPKSCVWKISRSRLQMANMRPEEETFGENVGTLTREVFGLEVVKSGFHQLLIQSVEIGKSYDELLKEYDGQLGFEAKAILKALVIHRDKGSQH